MEDWPNIHQIEIKRPRRLDPSILSFGLICRNSQQEKSLRKFSDYRRCRLDMRHESLVIIHVMIATENRDGASSTLSYEAEKCVEDRDGCSAVARLNDEISFGSIT